MNYSEINGVKMKVMMLFIQGCHIIWKILVRVAPNALCHKYDAQECGFVPEPSYVFHLNVY